MIELVLVILGLCLGSFINALVWRLRKQSDKRSKKGEYSIVNGRSMCSHCKHPLAVSDLIPVISWLSLGGRCRYCKKPIPDTPLPELLMPILLLVSYWLWPGIYGSFSSGWVIGLFAVWALVLTCFVALAIYDARWFLLPDRVVLPLTILSIVFTILCIVISGDLMVGVWAGLGAATIAGTFYAIELASNGRWIGHGDVKLGISLGLLAGNPAMALLVIFIASLLGTAYAVTAVLLGRGRSSKRSVMLTMVPFGPFLLAATFVVVLWGQGLVDWYWSLIVL